jgi:hypothetical protein
VVEHEVDARARDQGGELFQKLQGLEDQVARAVGPRGLSLCGVTKLAVEGADGPVWFWIGTHANYDKLLG